MKDRLGGATFSAVTPEQIQDTHQTKGTSRCHVYSPNLLFVPVTNKYPLSASEVPSNGFPSSGMSSKQSAFGIW